MLRSVVRLLAVAAVLLPAAAAVADPFRIIVPEPETPLVPNSVIDLAEQMGYYKKAGVDVEIVRVKATPAAIAALSSGQGEMANVSLDVAIQLVARDQLKLRGVISPDKALPYMIIAKKGLTNPKDLEGKVFGVGQVGSADYVQTRNVLANLGVDIDKIKYLAIGQPSVRAQSLIAGQIDATTVALGTYLTMPNREAVDVMLDSAAYFKAAPFITKLSVVTAETAAKKPKEIEAVVKATIAASRDFAARPELWVEGMVKARPDVPREQLEALAKAYAGHWSVDGGLDMHELIATTDALNKSPDFKDLPRRVEPKDWIDRSFIDAALGALGPSTPAAGK
jgi:NitT/TauT family transport system substrate-binding protein